MAVEIRRDGGVLIAGTMRDLNSLALHIMRAAATGHAQAGYVTDQALISVEIVRTDV